MNKAYTLILAATAAFATSANGQWVQRHQLPVWAEPGHIDISGLPVHSSDADEERAGGDVIFSEDFANGMAGNNQLNQPWTREGPDADIWDRTTTGPNSPYTGAGFALTSTTASNGWMIFDVARSNTDTLADPDETLPAEERVSRDGYLVSPLMDLSATPRVHLEFQTSLAWCCTGIPVFFVDVSVDGGNSWPTRLKATRVDHLINESVGTYTMYLDLGDAIQGDPTNVKFRFAWEGSSQTSGMALYFVQIDDVRIVESYAHDVEMTNPVYNPYDWFLSTILAEFEIVPLPAVWEFNLGSPVMNHGAQEATNVNMNYVMTRDGAEVLNDDITVGSMAPGALDSGFFFPWTPDAVGEYTLNLTLSMDSADARPVGNEAERSFEISEYVYAQDDSGRDDEVDNEDGDYHACNFFWIENDITVYGLQVALASGSGNSQIGGEYSGVLLDGDLAEIDSPTLPNVISASNQLSGNNQARWQTLLFDSPVEVVGQQEILACLRYDGIDASPRVTTACGGRSQPGQSLFIVDNLGTAFLQTRTPMVRLNLNPSVGIEDADRQDGIGLGQNYPNPAQTSTTIPYSLDKAGSVRFELYDLSGKLVEGTTVGRRAAGSHRFNYDVSKLNEGIYYFTIVVDGVRLTKRMTVIH